MNLTITHAKSSDINAMTALLAELFAIETDFPVDDEKQIRALALLVPDAMCDVIVAKEGDKLVGMATMQPVISTAEGGYVGIIEDVIVSESYRKQKIGTRLIAYLEASAAKKGFKAVKLLADKNNSAALHFYKTAGFAQTNMIMLRRRLTS